MVRTFRREGFQGYVWVQSIILRLCFIVSDIPRGVGN